MPDRSFAFGFDDVLARTLGGHEGAIGGVDELFFGLIRPQKPDTNTDGHRQRREARAVFHASPDALCHLDGNLAGGAGHHNRELFPAVPGTDVEDAHASPKQVGNIAQRAIAFQMTERVVDPLEVIDVDHQQREILLLATSTLDFGLKPSLKVPAIEKAGDGIDRRGAGQLVKARGHTMPRQRQHRRRRKQANGSEIARVERPIVGAIGERHNREAST